MKSPFLHWMMKISNVQIATLSREEREQRKRVGKDTDLNTRCAADKPFAMCIFIISQKNNLSILKGTFYEKKPAGKKSQPAKVTYPHFRRYKFEEGGKKKKAKHPKLIVERDGGKYGFMGLTEEKKRGHHNNFPLKKNPQKRHSEPAYIREELRYDLIENFSQILSDYRLSKKDKKRVLEFVQKMKQKKK